MFQAWSRSAHHCNFAGCALSVSFPFITHSCVSFFLFFTHTYTHTHIIPACLSILFHPSYNRFLQEVLWPPPRCDPISEQSDAIESALGSPEHTRPCVLCNPGQQRRPGQPVRSSAYRPSHVSTTPRPDPDLPLTTNSRPSQRHGRRFESAFEPALHNYSSP